MEYHLYHGKIINTDDPLQIGRVQVKIIPEMEDINDNSLLPWIRPFSLKASSSTSYSANIPNVGEYVFCIFLDHYYKNGYWVSKSHIDGFFNHKELQAILADIEELNVQEYPQPDFIKYSDGSIYFRNTESGEVGIVHSSGSYALINHDGEIVLSNDSNYIKLKENSLEILNNKLLSITNNDASKKVNIDFENDTIDIVNSVLNITTDDLNIISKRSDIQILKNENTSLTEIKTVSNEYIENVGGSKKQVIGEDKVETIIGDKKTIIVGQDELTIGLAQMTISALGNNLTIQTNGTINII